MIYKESKENLLKQGLIKKCSVDWKAIKNLMKRAYTDLRTAKRNIDDDEECAYNYAYNAMLRSGLALMFSQGFRPEIKDKHLTIVKFVSSILGSKFKKVINDYDFMRRKRHRFTYEPDIPCSRKEAEDAIKTAKEFLDIIGKLAYILCTVAEQSSKTAVEQILGRVMRLPKARKKTRQELNIAYAFAASQSFDEAAKTLQDGLVQNGFERQEARDLVAPLSEPQIELFGFDRRVEAPPIAKVLEAPHKPIPSSLSDKVIYNPDTRSIALKEYLSPEEEEQLKGCFSTEESKKEIGKLCIYVREKGEYERLSPAERGVSFAIPVLSIHQGNLFEQFEKTHIDNVGWALSPDDAILTESEFSLAADIPQIGEVDITKNGKLEAHFLPELEKQMMLFTKHSGWNVGQLVHSLDRSFAHPDLSAEEMGIFLNCLVTYLIDIRSLSIDQLTDHRYKLSQEIQRKINDLRAREQRKVFQAFLLPECATPLTVDRKVQFQFQPEVYPCNTRYDGRYRFRKHYYPVVGELRDDGEEFECAKFIDNLSEVKHWVRNLSGPGRENSSFWLQTSTDKFYPDFVCELTDGRQLVVEYKNARDWSNEDSTEKRNLGELWEERSGGRCLFVMPKGVDDLESIRVKIVNTLSRC